MRQTAIDIVVNARCLRHSVMLLMIDCQSFRHSFLVINTFIYIL